MTHPSYHHIHKPHAGPSLKQEARILAELRKKGKKEDDHVHAIEVKNVAKVDELTRISVENRSKGHKNYMIAVPMYSEYVASGCSSYSDPYDAPPVKATNVGLFPSPFFPSLTKCIIDIYSASFLIPNNIVPA